jgi:cell division protein FtsL
MMRVLNIVVIVALVLAASWVYKIKFEATEQAERLAKLRGEIRRERDVIASLRAEWSKLDSPARIQGLARRHLDLKPIGTRQFEMLENLPQRVPQVITPPAEEPVSALIDPPDSETMTGGIASPAGAPSASPSHEVPALSAEPGEGAR